jgi:iron(III) transport system substrate-binding protein
MARKTLLSLTLCFSLMACGGERPNPDASAAPANGAINVYSARHYDSDQALLDEFTRETGIKVNILEGNSDQLIQRMVNEAEFSPADVLLTVDAGRLWRGAQEGVFQPLDAPELLDRVPENMRDENGYWIALTKRARVIVYKKDKGAPEGLDTYEDLAKPEFSGQVCMRSSTNTYNQSLLASIIARDGEEEAEAWVKGVVANFDRAPQGNDISLLRSVAAGECGLTLANTYYIARLAISSDAADREVYQNIGIIFPNQETSGTHVNISGIGIAKYAPHPEKALQLIEFLSRDDIQAEFSKGNNEYPAVVGVEAAPQVRALGEFREDDLHANRLGEQQATAVRVFDRAGWK